MTKDGLWDKIAGEVSDDVVHMFTAVGRYDELAGAIEKRFGGVSDAVYASTSADKRPAIPKDVLQDIKRIPMTFEGFDRSW